MHGLLFSLESLPPGNEIIPAVNHFMNGIEVNDVTLALEVINKIGPEGNFLMEENTRKFLKKEGWYPKFLNREKFQARKAEGSKTINQKLEQEVHKIIEEDVDPLISDDEMKGIDKVIAEREKKLAEEMV